MTLKKMKRQLKVFPKQPNAILVCCNQDKTVNSTVFIAIDNVESSNGGEVMLAIMHVAENS